MSEWVTIYAPKSESFPVEGLVTALKKLKRAERYTDTLHSRDRFKAISSADVEGAVGTLLPIQRKGEHSSRCHPSPSTNFVKLTVKKGSY